MRFASVSAAMASCILILLFASLASFAQGDITVDSCISLSQAVARINTGENLGNILLPAGISFDLSCSGGLTVSRSIVIIGQGTPYPTISGIGAYTLFSLGGSESISISLQNVVLANGKGSNGGCLYLPLATQIGLFLNVVFQNCIADNGGAIYSASSNLNFNNALFTNNSATSLGGAIAVFSSSNQITVLSSKFTFNSVNSATSPTYGGAIYSQASLSILNSNFTLNSAISSNNVSNGGAVMSTASVNIAISTFYLNTVSSTTADVSGGGLSVSGVTNITSSTFQRNSVYSAAGSGFGGGISCAYIEISQSTFSANGIDAVSSRGGGVYSSSFAKITKTNFLFNNAYARGYVANGGAVSFGSGDTTFSAVRFISNSIFSAAVVSTSFVNQVSGGAVYSMGTLIDSGSYYEGNSASSNETLLGVDVYGGAVSTLAGFNISSARFSANIVSSFSGNAAGGAVACFGFLSMNSTVLVRNSATSGCSVKCIVDIAGGGAIFNNYGSYISSCTINRNTFFLGANNSIASGGAVYLSNSASLPHEVVSTTFSFNNINAPLGTARGGALFIRTSNASPKISNSFFTDNFANGSSASGGALYLGDNSLTVMSTSFLTNYVNAVAGDANGGAVTLSALTSNTEIAFFKCIMRTNKATSVDDGATNGGAIFHGEGNPILPSKLTISQSRLIDNSAVGNIMARGGSIYISKNQTFFASRTDFIRSQAVAPTAMGGTIFSDDFSTTNFCGYNYFDTGNIISRGRVSNNFVHTGLLPTVRFCPRVLFPIDSGSSTFTPSMRCDVCGCGGYNNPCDPQAQCTMVNNFPTCLCPPQAPGSGFTCGRFSGCVA